MGQEWVRGRGSFAPQANVLAVTPPHTHTYTHPGGPALSNVDVAINVLADAALQCVCRSHEVEVEEVRPHAFPGPQTTPASLRRYVVC